MLKQSPENLASMQEEKKYKILTDCQIILNVSIWKNCIAKNS